jgi:heat shock protein HslJ
MRAVLISLLALAACSTATPPAAAPAAAAIHLSGTSWIRVDDENASPHNPTIEFSDARASGYDGCNQWFAAVTQSGESLRFGDVGTTRMACSGAGDAAERNFLAALAATRYGHYDQDTLVLLDSEQHQLARLEANR